MTHTVSRRSFVVSAAAMALSMPLLTRAAVAASQSGTPAAGLDALGLPALNITITADAYEGVPTSTAAGRYLVTATGDAESTISFLQPVGMSVDDFFNALQGGGESSPASDGGTPASGDEGGSSAPPPFFYEFLLAGGVIAEPGQKNQAVVDLTPGDWVAWGDDPEAKQKPVTFTVTGEMPADLPEPKANATVTLIDFEINITEGELASGDNVIRLENKGAQPHFLILMKGPDDMTKDQIKGAVEADMSGTPVAGGLDPNKDLMPVVSTATQSKGTTMWFTATLEPGTYAALCFFPDEKTGMPHAAMGMYNVFKVAK